MNDEQEHGRDELVPKGKMELDLADTNLVQRGLQLSCFLQTRERTVLFPSDHSIGSLYLYGVSQHVLDYDDDAVYLGDAQDSVIVPQGQVLGLNCNPFKRVPNPDYFPWSPDLKEKCVREYRERTGWMWGEELEKNFPSEKIHVLDFSPLSCLRPDDLAYLDFNWVFDGEEIADDELRHIGRLTGLLSLNFGEAILKPEGISYLNGLRDLKYLEIHCEDFTDPCLRQVGNLKNLVALSLGGTGISDDGLDHLMELPRLEYLYLNNTEIGDRIWVALQSLPSLTSLDVSGTKVTGIGLSAIQVPHGLRSLSMRRCPNDETTLSHIDRLVQLEELGLGGGLDGGGFSDGGLRSVGRLPHLLALDLGMSGVSSVGLRHLLNSHTLQILSLILNHLGDAEMMCLQNFSGLQKLSLDYTGITEQHLRFLKELRFLRHLSIASNNIHNDGIKYLQHLNCLESLDLSSTQITDDGIQFLESLTSLKQLDLSRTNIGDKAIESLKNMKELKFLCVGLTKITTEGVGKLKDELPKTDVNENRFGFMYFPNSLIIPRSKFRMIS